MIRSAAREVERDATSPAVTVRVPDGHADSRLWRSSLQFSGSIIFCLACIGLAAWIASDVTLIQLAASLPPPHYNSLLAMLVWGVTLIALGRGWSGLARSLSMVLCLLGAILLLSDLSPSFPRLDHWWLSPDQASRPFPAGGVGILVALAFLLGSYATLLSAKRAPSLSEALIPSLIGALLLIAGPLALLTGADDGFFRLSGLSVLESATVLIAGAALLTSVCRRGLPTFALGHLVPLTVGLVGFSVTFGLWLALNVDQNHRISRQTQFEVANVQRIVRERLLEHDDSLRKLSNHWQSQIGLDRDESISRHIGQLPGCLGVAHIDEKLELKWENSVNHARLPQTPADLGIAEGLASVVREGRFSSFRPPRSYWSGTRVMITFAPHVAGSPSGGLVCIIRIEDFFAAMINASVAPGYGIRIQENDGEMFNRLETRHQEPNRWNASIPLGGNSFGWRLVMWPSQDVLDRESLSLPKLALILGLFSTFLLALAVYLAQTARRRTFALEREVRERELAQRALIRSEEKYRTLIENLGQGIFLQDCEHRFVAANAQFCKSIGRVESEIVGATEASLFEPQKAATLFEEVRTVLAEGKTVETEDDSLVDGHRRCVRRVLTPVRDDTGRRTGVLGICWDVTEQRQLEVHVHQASKMDAIGQLAGGIAHDFNNLLTVILGNLELILGDLHEYSPHRDLALSARNAAARATSLTQRLLGFSRRHQLDWTPTNLNSTVEEVVHLLHRTIDPLIRIETHCDPNLWSVQGDAAQLNQVLMNLCLNARDAISGAGQITIETHRIHPSDPLPNKTPGSRDRELVRLSVTDTGSGMPPEVKSRIYEPFFTTKEVGKGTGLGLPMVFAIVRQHKGWIECWSEVGKGTRFEIYLPRGETSSEPQTETAITSPRRSGRETILIVDDEEMIRQLAVTTLRACGYTVLQAEDGQKAINLYSSEFERIDLVILDLTMPVLSGHEAFRHLLALNPRVRVLFASGYAAEQLSELEKELMAGFLNKPFRPNELILAVEESLQRRTPSHAGEREHRLPTESSPQMCPETANRNHDLATLGTRY